eukprot:m.489287 g.489287  ORF g.489287 m.489287 type:complete len:222 (-) comp26568_c0_seq1:59-724(-)
MCDFQWIADKRRLMGDGVPVGVQQDPATGSAMPFYDTAEPMTVKAEAAGDGSCINPNLELFGNAPADNGSVFEVRIVSPAKNLYEVGYAIMPDEPHVDGSAVRRWTLGDSATVMCGIAVDRNPEFVHGLLEGYKIKTDTAQVVRARIHTASGDDERVGGVETGTLLPAGLYVEFAVDGRVQLHVPLDEDALTPYLRPFVKIINRGCKLETISGSVSSLPPK